mmetsp:Transcript_25775/g.33782  ORF Transcript_25775/g.33782 Transcript_25775/m.33782 type:complete len:334 (+) Transcript_25775:200-1201(+)|eukprot:CAMPEP_0117758370 /NCGR_PEP_ID=MMETSP0947-20121206/15336_1 /TAXON_ID=44440 /ORGANISM="Chattonella subsalsa, Strain CCMP2191" /LENGTH=333 /DNA_ID=CAMNT_0005578541 /DNA_START=187 /DNA_END=1188 /DNA_ORIENTATION=-
MDLESFELHEFFEVDEIEIDRSVCDEGNLFSQQEYPHIDAGNVYELQTLIRQYLSDHTPAFVFFDIDETVVKRDTAFVYGFESTNELMKQLSSSAPKGIVNNIGLEMEKDYYSAKVDLVDSDLKNVIDSIRSAGHCVLALTSNSCGSQHVNDVISAMSANGVVFSESLFSGILPNSKATVRNNDSINGIIFCNSESDNKGEVILDYLNQLSNTSILEEENFHAILVDNTRAKCDKANQYILEHYSKFLSFHAIHYTQAEDSVTSVQLRRQLSRILSRLHLKGDEMIVNVARNCHSISHRPCFCSKSPSRRVSCQNLSSHLPQEKNHLVNNNSL